MTETHPQPVLTETCPNCHTQLQGQFCGTCGQNQKGFDRFFFSLVSEAFEDIFATDSRAGKTIVALLLRPGFLTKEYFAGRRARYVQPLRLYFITSLLFFFVMSMENTFMDTQLMIDQDGNSIEIEETKEDFEFIDKMQIGFLTEEENSEFANKILTQIRKIRSIAKNEPDRIVEWVIDIAPPLMFCLLPILALLFKVFYFTSGRFYTEHLVLAVHNHCFIYIAMLISGFFDYFPEGNIIWQSFKAIIGLWLPIYLLISLKTTYGGGWIINTLKYLLIGISYSIFFGVTALITGLVGLMTL